MKTNQNMRIYGELIYSKVFNLSSKVNSELLEPMSKWLNDPEYMTKHNIDMGKGYNWRIIKRRQREFSELQRMTAIENLRKYHRELKRKKQYMKEIGGLLKKSPLRETLEICRGTYLQKQEEGRESYFSFLSSFSSKDIILSETTEEFDKLREIRPETLIPLKAILIEKLSSEMTFEALEKQSPEMPPRGEGEGFPMLTILKLHETLQMANDGLIHINQANHLGTITLTPSDESFPSSASVTILKKDGLKLEKDWLSLSEIAKSHIIEDAMNKEIICRCN